MPVAPDQLGEPDHHFLAISRMKTAPAPVIKRLARFADGKIDISGITGRHFGKQLAGRRVDAVECLATCRLAKAAINERRRCQGQPIGDCLVFLVSQQL